MQYPVTTPSNAIYANGDWACVHQPLGSGATRVSLKGRVSPLLQPSLFNIVESPIWDIKKPFGTQKATPTDFTERDKRGSVSRNTGLVSQNLNFSVMASWGTSTFEPSPARSHVAVRVGPSPARKAYCFAGVDYGLEDR